MIKLSKFQEVKLQKPAPKGIAVYGEPMAGKTTFAGKSDKPLFLSFDRNAKNAGYNAIIPETYQDVVDIIEQAPDAGYKTIVIDTAEDMANMIELEVLDNHKAKKQVTTVQVLASLTRCSARLLAHCLSHH